jgi:hypothetical protein
MDAGNSINFKTFGLKPLQTASLASANMHFAANQWVSLDFAISTANERE